MGDREDLRLDVGQLLWVGFDGVEVPAYLRRAIRAGEAGAAILATVWPPMLSFDRLDDEPAEAMAESVGRAMAVELAALGFDIDFAPVLDTHTNPDNPIIGNRAFATTPERVARRALAFASGLERGGLVPCGKHFPGHGDTTVDSHLELPRLEHDLDRLRAVELMPFERASAARLPLLMTAHVVFPAIEEGVPATLSRRVLTDLLRGELGYRGLVVSDDLDMKAVSRHFDVGEAAVAAVEAGCDALLLCRDTDAQRAAYESLVREAEARSTLRARVAAAAASIRSLKRAHWREPRPRPDVAEIRAIVGRVEHQRLALQLAGD
ncbi:MAG: glycoside hydrolase family 3 protein [Deltaproteobacteria bacterium]|nr:glycoside hydrolase family 3 protein [Deltaproteobacteria bacterium]